MTDLSKGIIEVDGFEINSNTSSFELINEKKDNCAFYTITNDGNCELFRFENVEVFNKLFKVKITFIKQKLSEIKMFSYFDKPVSYEERFQADCAWLKDNLGEPSKINEDGNSYYYDGLHIYSFIQRDLSRNPAETYIVCKYSR